MPQRVASVSRSERPGNPSAARAGDNKFPRSVRLLRHADFESVYEKGRRLFSSNLTVFYQPRPGGEGLRVGFTVSRALGGAVVRNRMKRRLREAVRLRRPEANIPVDIVINPKKSLLLARFEDLLKEVGRAFEVIQQKSGV